MNSLTSYAGALSVRPLPDYIILLIYSVSQGSVVVDRIGRRKLLLIGTTCCVVILAIVTGLLSDTTAAGGARSNTGITFIFLFGVVFSFGWTAMWVGCVVPQSLSLKRCIGKHCTPPKFYRTRPVSRASASSTLSLRAAHASTRSRTSTYYDNRRSTMINLHL